MFLKRLVITYDGGIIRDIAFQAGLNLVVDKTPSSDKRKTGNNVGKTTVLKLIDFCLGENAKGVYSDPESRGATYREVEEFLVNRHVTIRLELVDSLDTPLRTVVIERDFLKGARATRTIDGNQIQAQQFTKELGYTLFPSLPESGKPTFRQVISHNIRYKDFNLERTLQTLGPYAKPGEYEALYLYMLGCKREDAAAKQELAERRKAEMRYLDRLRNGRSTNDYRVAIAAIDEQIEACERKRSTYEDNSEIGTLIAESEQTKAALSRIIAQIGQNDLRLEITRNALAELEASKSEIDVSQLEQLYMEADAFIPELHASFEQLVNYHNSMTAEKMKFIASELPGLESTSESLHQEFEILSARDDALTKRLAQEMSGADYEALIYETNKLFEQRGQLGSLLEQLEETEKQLESIAEQLDAIAANEKTGRFKQRLDRQVKRFNEFFGDISSDLYGERYLLAFDTKTDKNGTEYYDFHLLNATNMSSGKKQGEILCFDVAYTAFAGAEGIDCLHFLLNDKKELMHGNQFSQIDSIARKCDTQFIVPILADKLPDDANIESRIILTLSQEDKLFRIEALS